MIWKHNLNVCKCNSKAWWGNSCFGHISLHWWFFYVNYSKLQIVFLLSLLNGWFQLPTSGKQMSLDLYVSNAQFIKPVQTHPSWAMLYLVYWIYNTSLSAFLCKEIVLACFGLLYIEIPFYSSWWKLHPLFFWICTCKILYQYIVNERISTICKRMFFLKSPEYCYLFNYGQYYSSKYINICITAIISIKQKKCLLIYSIL